MEECLGSLRGGDTIGLPTLYPCTFYFIILFSINPITQLPPKNPAQQKLLENKIVQGEPGQKNRASAFYYHCFILMFDAVAHQTKMMHKLKVRKKIHEPENYPTSPHPPQSIVIRP